MNSHDLGFENDQLVPIAPVPEPTDDDLLNELLAELGVTPTRSQRMLADAVLTSIALRRASDALGALLIRLDGTAAGVALRRALLGDGGLSLRDEAERIGCSHVTIFKHEAKIRQRLPGLTAGTNR